MRFDITELWTGFKQIFIPAERQNPPKEQDQQINQVAIERIKKSPGRQNLHEIYDEPDWYHE